MSCFVHCKACGDRSCELTNTTAKDDTDMCKGDSPGRFCCPAACEYCNPRLISPYALNGREKMLDNQQKARDLKKQTFYIKKRNYYEAKMKEFTNCH